MAEVIRIGAFFDGTGGNKDNDELIKDGVLTNVAKLYDAYKEKKYIVLYEPGVATREYTNGKTFTEEQVKAIQDGKKTRADYYNIPDFAIGYTSKSISDSMMEKINKQIGDIRDKNPAAQISVDVFGFSRGAAISRDFINSFNEKYKDDKNVNVDFVGLYDTVASVGTKHDLYNGGLNLDLNEQSANKIIQFTAIDEYRTNFPLHSIKDKNGNLPKNMEEKALYGAHADIGGGYPDHYQDNIIKEQGNVFYVSSIDKQKKIDALCKSKEGEGYEKFIDDSLQNNEALWGRFSYQCIQKEDKTNILGRVVLHATYQELAKHGIDLPVLNNPDHTLPEQFKDYTKAIVNNEDITKYKDIVKPYISESGRNFITKEGDVRETNLMMVIANIKSSIREVFNNEPQKAYDKSINETDKLSTSKEPHTIQSLKDMIDKWTQFQTNQQETKKDYGIDRQIER